MGVDDGWDGGTSPPEFGVGDANANSPPPQILSYRYRKEHSLAFKICQNPFSAGALPRTPLGELMTLPPDPIVSWGGDTPPHTPPTRHRLAFSARDASPPEFQPDLCL